MHVVQSESEVQGSAGLLAKWVVRFTTARHSHLLIFCKGTLGKCILDFAILLWYSIETHLPLDGNACGIFFMRAIGRQGHWLVQWLWHRGHCRSGSSQTPMGGSNGHALNILCLIVRLIQTHIHM